MKIRLGELLRGPAGTAQEVIIEEVDRPEQTATLSCWFLYCPGQSFFWSYYYLVVIHLRPIPGVEPPVIRVPHVTHEVGLYALSPDHHPSVTDPDTWVPLHPVNVAEQVQLTSDDSAREVLGLVARAVVDGRLWAEPPLSGMVEPWRTVLIKTSAHDRGEPHAR